MTRPPLDPAKVAEMAHVLWVCWENGEPIRLAYFDVAERWLRRGNYMHRSISPLAYQSEAYQADFLARFPNYADWSGSA